MAKEAVFVKHYKLTGFKLYE